MGDPKKIYLDGKLVGEIDATGDNEHDGQLAMALLRQKGLYQKPTLEQSMFRQAVSFATTASYLHKRDLTSVPRNGLSVAPFVVNSAFALEMYLKTLGQVHDKKLRGHDLLKLFDALPNRAHEELLLHFETSKWQCGIVDLAGLRRALRDMRAAFVEWRYLHETDRSGEIRFDAMIFAMEVLHETCKASGKVIMKLGEPQRA